jgi:hypothetical protein
MAFLRCLLQKIRRLLKKSALVVNTALFDSDCWEYPEIDLVAGPWRPQGARRPRGADAALSWRRRCAQEIISVDAPMLVAAISKVGLYPIVTLQYSSTTLYHFS